MLKQAIFETTVLIKAHREDENGDWYVSGPIASLVPDYDGETLHKSGILEGLKMFDHLGSHVDYGHMYDKTLNPKWLIGKGVAVTEENGVPWLTVKLFKAKEWAQSLWEHVTAGGHAGFSIQGFARKRDARDPSQVLRTEIHKITIDPSPKGLKANTFLKVGPAPSAMVLAKAIMSGDTENWDTFDTDEEAQKAVEGFRHVCPDCGGKMYCIHCHNASQRTPAPSATPAASAVVKSYAGDQGGGDGGNCSSCGGSNTTDYGYCPDCGAESGDGGDAGAPSMKSLVTGSDIVVGGDQGGQALRKQDLRGGLASSTFCSDCHKPKTKGQKCKFCHPDEEASSNLTKALLKRGVSDPNSIVAEVTRRRQLMRRRI